MPRPCHVLTPPAPPPLALLLLLWPQRGDAAGAMPLYERALEIYEGSMGRSHPDVAHTLTDIAVIHLEQVGRQAGSGC